jgi:hypothetical protein
MKKALKAMVMLLFVVSMTTLTSCNKEAEKLIVGKWECTSAVDTDYSISHTMPWLIGMVWEFKTNGDFIGTIDDDEYGDVTVSASYSILADVLTITYIDEDGDVESESYIIKELTKTKLVIKDSDWDEEAMVEFKKIL